MDAPPKPRPDPGRWVLLGCAVAALVAALSWTSWRLHLEGRARARGRELLQKDPAVPRVFGPVHLVGAFSSWRMSLANILSFRSCRVQYTVWGVRRSSAVTLTLEGSDLRIADALVWDGALESGSPLVLETP